MATLLQFDEVFSKARDGETEALGGLLETYRSYLRVLAASQLSNKLGQRVSASDIVQDTMLAAHRDFGDFRGESSEQFSAWLRVILSRNLFRAIERHIKADKRDIRREVSLDQVAGSVDSSAVGLANLLASDQSTASRIVSRGEETRRVVDLLVELPEHYQQVIMLRNFQNLRFEEVAQEMGRTSTATRLLWLRALKKLRELYEAGASR